MPIQLANDAGELHDPSLLSKAGADSVYEQGNVKDEVVPVPGTSLKSSAADLKAPAEPNKADQAGITLLKASTDAAAKRTPGEINENHPMASHKGHSMPEAVNTGTRRRSTRTSSNDGDDNMMNSVEQTKTQANSKVDEGNNHVTNQVVQPNQLSAPPDNAVASCVVKLPPGTKVGDILTIRWPTTDQFARYQSKEKRADSSKRRRLNNSDSRVPSPVKSDADQTLTLLVNITVPSNITVKRNKLQYIKVHSPWLANQRAANTTLDSRQLRTIGIETSAGSRRSRRVERRNRGEGNVEKRSCPIGELHQVSGRSIPKAGTWNKEKEVSGDVECKQLWDSSRGINACKEDERIDQYIDSLETHQKVKFVEYLHQSNYVFDAAKEKFETEMKPNGEDELLHNDNGSIVVLEGAPLTQSECEAFNNAITEHQKQFTVIAKAVGTTVSRCLVHYYSKYKSGQNVGKYLELKKMWEQSDECEICGDGGELLCCDGCINSCHRWCLTPPLLEVPDGKWFCDNCVKKPTAS